MFATVAHMKRAFLPLLLLLVASCSGDAQWEKARAEYCMELELLSRDVASQLDTVHHFVQGLDQEPPEARREGCLAAASDLKALSARLRGFTVVVHVLARARPEGQDVEQAGFVTNVGGEAIQGYDDDACLHGNILQARQQVTGIEEKVARDFARGLAVCQAAVRPR
jgi:hypothetical protein